MTISYIKQVRPSQSQIWLPFKDQATVESVESTTSHGDTIRYMQVGDGVTSSTYPTVIGEKGYRFEASQYVTFLSADSLTLGDYWSIGMLIRPKLPSGGQTDKYLCGFSNGGGIILNDSSSDNELTFSDGTTTVSSGINLANDRYYFICITKDSESIKIYINGELVKDGSALVTFDLDYIGCDNTLNNFYNGEIRELFSFDVELDEIQIDVLNGYLYRKVANQELYFDPSSIPDLAAWFEATDSDSVLTKATQPTITNGDFESGTTGWGTLRSTLSTTAVNPYEGANSLVITNDGTGQPFATQTAMIVGNRTRLRGAGRSVNGIGIPSIGYLSGTWLGTTSTDWQEFDEQSTDTNIIGLKSNVPNQDVGFDGITAENLSRTEWYPRAGSLGGKLEQATANNQPWWTGEGVRFGELGVEVRNMTFDTPIVQTTNQTIYFAVDKLLATNAYRALIQRTNASSPQPYLSAQTGTLGESAIFVGGGPQCVISTPIGKYIIRYRHTASLVGLQKGNSSEVTYVVAPTLSTWDALSGSVGGQGMEATLFEMIIVNDEVSESNDLKIKQYLSTKHSISL